MPASLFQTMMSRASRRRCRATTLLSAGLAGVAVFLLLRDPAGELEADTQEIKVGWGGGAADATDRGAYGMHRR